MRAISTLFVVLSLSSPSLAAWVQFQSAPTVTSADPTVGVLPSYDDAYANWKNAGLASVGGIATNEPSTQCGSTLTPSGGDDGAAINAALAACSNGYVLLGTGQFKVSWEAAYGPWLIQITNNNVVLRGSGTCNGSTSPIGNNSHSPLCPTSIVVTDGVLAYTGGQCGTDISHEIACPNGNNTYAAIAMYPSGYRYPTFASCSSGNLAINCGATPLTADAAQGDKTITVSSTSGYSAGQWVLIDEASGAGWITDPMGSGTSGAQQGCTNIWAEPDTLNSSGSPATGRFVFPKGSNCYFGSWDIGANSQPTDGGAFCWHSYCDRPNAEMHKIASVNAGANTITFDDPLTIAFRVAGPINFNGAISGSTLTTTGDSCTMVAGHIVTGVNVIGGQYVMAVNSCSGGVGNYTLYQSQSTVSSEAMTGGAHEAQIYQPGSILQYAGVENLSINRAEGSGIYMNLCAYCWAKNVDIGGWVGGGISVQYSARSELNSVYVHHTWYSVSNGGEYPISIDNAATEVLVTNSITNFAGKGMVARSGGAGSVVSYNYQDDTMYDSWSGTGNYWEEMGINGSHMVGPHHILFEGNWGTNLDSDSTHGSSIYQTYFRNQGTSARTPFTDPSLAVSTSVNDFTGVGSSQCANGTCTNAGTEPPKPLRAAGPATYSYWFSFVGNVLGTSGKTTSGNGWSYAGDFTSHRVWMIGWSAGNGGQDPYIDGVSGSYIFQHGNYDYTGGGPTGCSTVGSGERCWNVGYADHVLPNSFYLSSQPSFFASTNCAYPWPWVTPELTTQLPGPTNQSGHTCSSPNDPVTGIADSLPAKARWDAGTPFVQP